MQLRPGWLLAQLMRSQDVMLTHRALIRFYGAEPASDLGWIWTTLCERGGAHQELKEGRKERRGCKKERKKAARWTESAEDEYLLHYWDRNVQNFPDVCFQISKNMLRNGRVSYLLVLHVIHEATGSVCHDARDHSLRTHSHRQNPNYSTTVLEIGHKIRASLQTRLKVWSQIVPQCMKSLNHSTVPPQEKSEMTF